MRGTRQADSTSSDEPSRQPIKHEVPLTPQQAQRPASPRRVSPKAPASPPEVAPAAPISSAEAAAATPAGAGMASPQQAGAANVEGVMIGPFVADPANVAAYRTVTAAATAGVPGALMLYGPGLPATGLQLTLQQAQVLQQHAAAQESGFACEQAGLDGMAATPAQAQPLPVQVAQQYAASPAGPSALQTPPQQQQQQQAGGPQIVYSGQGPPVQIQGRQAGRNARKPSHRTTAAAAASKVAQVAAAERPPPAKPKGRGGRNSRGNRHFDKGPCLNPACKTTDTPQWRLGPLVCRELCNKCGTRWQRAKNQKNPHSFFVWMVEDLKAKGLPVPVAVSALADDPAKAQAALQEVQEHIAGHKRNRGRATAANAAAQQAAAAAAQFAASANAQASSQEASMASEDLVDDEEEHLSRRAKAPRTSRAQGSAVAVAPAAAQAAAAQPAASPAVPGPALGAAASGVAQADADIAAAAAAERHSESGAPAVGQPAVETRRGSEDSNAPLMCSESLSDSEARGSSRARKALDGRKVGTKGQFEEDSGSEDGLGAATPPEVVTVSKRGRTVKTPAKYLDSEVDDKPLRRKANGGSISPTKAVTEPRPAALESPTVLKVQKGPRTKTTHGARPPAAADDGAATPVAAVALPVDGKPEVVGDQDEDAANALLSLVGAG